MNTTQINTMVDSPQPEKWQLLLDAMMSGIKMEPRSSLAEIDTFLEKKGVNDGHRRGIMNAIGPQCVQDQNGLYELEEVSKLYIKTLNQLDDRKKELEAALKQQPAELQPSSAIQSYESEADNQEVSEALWQLK